MEDPCRTSTLFFVAIMAGLTAVAIIKERNLVALLQFMHSVCNIKYDMQHFVEQQLATVATKVMKGRKEHKL